MKKVLAGIMAVLAAALIALYLVSEAKGFSADLYLGVGGVLFLAVFCVYAWGSGGIRCPHCGCRINPKYARRKAFEGRFSCTNCGAMIER